MPIEMDGPISWRNWKAQQNESPILGAYELKLYSDAWFVADSRNLGPYSFLNGVPRYGSAGRFVIKPCIVLRVEDYLPREMPDLSVTNDDDYHGGWLNDELAALSALLLDARIVAGPVEREFGGFSDDPLGRPITHAADLLPILPVGAESPQIPRLLGQRNLADLAALTRYPALDAKTARALIKSARLYQQALWISDTSPEISWLLLVAAVETVALEWDQTQLTPIERLELSFPSLTRHLNERDDPALVDLVATELRKLTAATSKFIKFATAFAPEAPSLRPLHSKFDFDRKALPPVLAKVYAYRSRALHAGTPFPHPMCSPPHMYGTEDAPEERPGGLAAGSRGSTWRGEDIPMLLHTFAWIARGAILNWWNSIDTRQKA